MVLEKTLESFLDCKEIKPVHPKGNQYWIFIGRADAEAETPVLWPPDAKNQFIGKDPNAGKDWRWEEKGMTEDEMVGWHHWLDGHEFEQAPGVGVREAWCTAVHSVTKSQTRLSNRTELNWTTPQNSTDCLVSKPIFPFYVYCHLFRVWHALGYETMGFKYFLNVAIVKCPLSSS